MVRRKSAPREPKGAYTYRCGRGHATGFPRAAERSWI